MTQTSFHFTLAPIWLLIVVAVVGLLLLRWLATKSALAAVLALIAGGALLVLVGLVSVYFWSARAVEVRRVELRNELRAIGEELRAQGGTRRAGESTEGSAASWEVIPSEALESQVPDGLSTEAAQVLETSASARGSSGGSQLQSVAESRAPRPRRAPATPRPAWVDEVPPFSNGVYYLKATIGPHASRELCLKEQPEVLEQLTRDYLASLIGAREAEHLVLPLDFVQEEVLEEQWEEPYESATAALGDMVRLHVLLKFDDKDRAFLREVYREQLIARRLTHTAVGGGLLLVLLSTVFGYFRLDTATKGYYTGRLKAAAVAVILLCAAGFVWLARQGGAF